MSDFTILIADDEALNRKVLSRMIKRLGHDYECVDDGDKALAALQENPKKFDLLLLDKMMPTMDGMDVLKAIKKDPTISDVVVILQTAVADKACVVEGINNGAYYYLVKPFEEEVLTSIVKTALEEKQFAKQQEQRIQIGTLADTLQHGCFSFKRLKEAEDIAATVSHLARDPVRVSFGLNEIMVNAIEHGNLGITYDDKTQLKNENRWYEEVLHRLTLEENRDKTVSFNFQLTESHLEVVIEDQGEGFDWQSYLEMDPARMFDNHGRGIALANKKSFSEITYNDCGNRVTCVMERSHNKHSSTT